MKSPIKWLGGKSALIHKVYYEWEDLQDYRWVDLFAGGLSLPLTIKPRKSLINDLNAHLINFWKWVQTDGIIDQSKYSFLNDKDYYYNARQEFNINPTPELFYYLNRTCFNGLYRESIKSGFNVPFGKYKNINYCYDFTPWQKIIKSWIFLNLSWENVKLEEKDFIFVDPPYDESFQKYTAKGFTWDNHVKLAETLSKLKNPMVVTNNATVNIINLYKSFNFKICFIDMPRRISCTGDRTPKKEIFATRNIDN